MTKRRAAELVEQLVRDLAGGRPWNDFRADAEAIAAGLRESADSEVETWRSIVGSFRDEAEVLKAERDAARAAYERTQGELEWYRETIGHVGKKASEWRSRCMEAAIDRAQLRKEWDAIRFACERNTRVHGS